MSLENRQRSIPAGRKVVEYTLNICKDHSLFRRQEGEMNETVHGLPILVSGVEGGCPSPPISRQGWEYGFQRPNNTSSLVLFNSPIQFSFGST